LWTISQIKVQNPDGAKCDTNGGTQ